jgi:LexA-binding, inner membrane-associated putative hydrolase
VAAAYVPRLVGRPRLRCAIVPSRRHLEAFADPLIHAGLAAAVVAPLGRRAMATAVVAGTVIDVDHPVAARSARLDAMLSMATRPRSHSLFTALAIGAIGVAAGGRVQGWAAFAGMASHLLRDAGDVAAPTPLLWPLAAPRQIGPVAAAAGIVGLAAGSWAISRWAAAAAAPTASAAADGGDGAAPPRTASARS